MNDTPADVRALVERIHATPTMAVVVVSGAGARALAWLLGVPGASRTLLEASVPYARAAMVEFLGCEPAEYVSPQTAVAMAEAAHRRAAHLRGADHPEARVVGLACTATIATDRPKRGAHRCSVASVGSAGCSTYDLVLTKGTRDRNGEEQVVSRLVLHALAEACGLPAALALGLLDGERLDVVGPRAGP